ncbi:atypical PIKK PI3K protein kinase [Suillus lakei]|nr:atypical PIKK PI3K protein kinase [Suillus lakei]
MDKDNRDDFIFAKLSDLKLPVTFRISQLEGSIPQPFHGARSSTLSDLYVSCQLLADNKPLTIPFRTSFKAFKNNYTWNEWITSPIRYCDLPLNSQITFTVWDIGAPRTAVPVGGSTFRMFGKKWTLRRGKYRLLLWAGHEADGSMQTKTPSKIGSRDEMGRLEKLVKKYERGDLPKSDWLDNMAFRKMEEMHASESMYLYVDLPHFDFPMIFSKVEAQNQVTIPFAAQTPVAPVLPCYFATNPHLWAILDPEIARENPVEDKRRRLVRGHRSSPYDRELKPNAKIGDELNGKDLIWKFRFYLARDKRGLTKFLESVAWCDPSEVKQATDVDTDDALELLGPGTVDARVRAFAVRQLNRADDEELLLLLRFESAASERRPSRSTRSAISYDDSRLTDFLIARGVQNHTLGNRLYWYLIVEVQLKDRAVAKMYGQVVFKFLNKILESENGSERRELMRQGVLVETLAKRAKELRTSKDSRPKKIGKLRSFINDFKNGLINIPPLPLPLGARMEITGILIFKDGDNTRQDQLVLQLGMVQFIPSKTIAAVIKENGTLLNYLRANNLDEGSIGTYGVEPSVIDTFVRSCAGYRVVTYLLGVGDRHLDNLLLTPDGKWYS